MSGERDISRVLRQARALLRQDRALSGEPERMHQLALMLMLRLLDHQQRAQEDHGQAPLIPAPYRWRDWAGALEGPALLQFLEQPDAPLPGGGRGPGLLPTLRADSADPRRRALAQLLEGADSRASDGALLSRLVELLDALPWADRDALGQVYEDSLRRLPGAGGSAGEFYTPRALVRAVVQAAAPKPGERVLDPACGSGGFLIEAWRHQGFSGAPPLGVEAKPLPALLAGVNLLLRGAELGSVARQDALDIDITDVEPDADVILVNPPFGGEEPPHVRARYPEALRTSDSALLFLLVVAARLRPGGRAAVILPEGVLSSPGAGARVRAHVLSRLKLRALLRLPPGVFTPYTDIRSNVLLFDAPGPSTTIHVLRHLPPPDRRGLVQPRYTQRHPLQERELLPFASWAQGSAPPPPSLGPALQVEVDDLPDRGWSLDLRPPTAAAPAQATWRADSLSELRRALADTEAQVEEALAELRAWSPEAWPRAPLSAVLRRHREPVEPAPERLYAQLTVRMRGRGVTLRQRVPGAQIHTRPQHRAHGEQLVFSRIDARNGAIGVVPAELDGALVTQDFPLFDVDPARADPRYLAALLTGATWARQIEALSGGTTNRRRAPLKQLLALPIPLPELAAQRAALAVVDAQSALEEAAAALADAAEGLAQRLDAELNTRR